MIITMQATVKPGRYVAAVSGGVDSMVLLDLLRKRPGVKLTVAHLDHGIRPDSKQDRVLVQSVARQHGLPFVHHSIALGTNAGEAIARQARYNFLDKIKKHSGANAIITAHHQDDLLETVIHNMLRGTKRRGFSSLKSTDGILRPLLGYTKEQIIDYANANKLHWREDSTNKDLRYRRNYIRHKILAKMTDTQKAQLKILSEEMHDLNREIDRLLHNIIHEQPHTHALNKYWYQMLPHTLAKEVMHGWLYQRGVKDLTNKRVEQLVVAAKTGKTGAKFPVDKHHFLTVAKNSLQLNKVGG